MEGSRQSSMNLSVQPPTKIEPIFHPFKEGKFTSVPMFAMVRTIQHFGHNLGSNHFVTWVLFPESPTMSMILFQSCGETQLAMISNLLMVALLMD
jgi:hypothetical protein